MASAKLPFLFIVRNKLQSWGLSEPLHMVDVKPYESLDTPVESARKITHEIEKWSDDLARKPRWLVLNKIDRLFEDEAEAHCKSIVDELKWTGPLFEISALKKQGTKELMYAIMDFLDQSKQEKSSEQE